jgi:hypothetical protein
MGASRAMFVPMPIGRRWFQIAQASVATPPSEAVST